TLSTCTGLFRFQGAPTRRGHFPNLERLPPEGRRGAVESQMALSVCPASVPLVSRAPLPHRGVEREEGLPVERPGVVGTRVLVQALIDQLGQPVAFETERANGVRDPDVAAEPSHA